MAESYINTGRSTATHEFGVLKVNTNHQMTLQAFESSSPMTPLNPSSGFVKISYQPRGSTAFIPMSDTFDLSSGPVMHIFSGSYEALKIETTHGSSTLTKGDYVGWKS